MPAARPARRTPAASALATFLALLVAVAAATAPDAYAQKREGAFGKGRPGGKLLKESELRDCLERQDRIHAATEETRQQQAKLQADRAEIDRLATVLKEQAATLDRKSSDAVGSYNTQVEARDKLIDGYQDAVPAFNARVQKLKAEQEEFARSCEGRRYDEDDAAAIRKRK